MNKEENRVYQREWARKNRAKNPALREHERKTSLQRFYKNHDRALASSRAYKAKESSLIEQSKRHLEKQLQKYNLTEDFLKIQLDRPCRICKKDFVVKERVGMKPKLDWVFDHDHNTGAFRGIIHIRCNSGLGFLGDTEEGLENAAKYLHKFDYEYEDYINHEVSYE